MQSRSTTLTLSLSECEPGALPPVCAKCGAPATGEKAATFSWFPKKILWLLLLSRLICLILIVIFRTSRTVQMPVCPEHAGVWNWGRTVLAGTAVTCLALLILAYALAEGPLAGAAPPLMLFAFLGVAVGLAVGFWTLSGGIQARRIDEREILLTKLHPDFVDAVENHSPERQAAYDALRAGRTLD